MTQDATPNQPDDMDVAHPSQSPAPHHDGGERNAPRRPRPLTLAIVGLVIVAAAVAAVVNGITSRAHAEKDLTAWANAEATPTVMVVRATANTAARHITLPGTIQAYLSAPLYARVSGYVKQWNADIGAKVTKGQELVEIDTPDLDQQYAQAEAQLSVAMSADKLATTTATRWHQLLSYQTVSQQDENEKASDALSKHAAVQAAQANVGQLQAMEGFKHITAPFDGIVTARHTDIGNLVNAGNSAGHELYQVSDVHKVRVYVQVPQAYAAELHPGLTATLSLPQFPDRTFDATLVSTANAFAEASRTVLVQLQADNPDDKLWPGTFTEVSFNLPADANVLNVPATALVLGASGTEVAVLGDGDKVTMRQVKLGRNLGDNAEILAGLTPADRVIDSPPEWLGDGDVVHVSAAVSPATQVAQQTDTEPAK